MRGNEGKAREIVHPLESSRGAVEAMGIVHALLDWLKAPEQTGLRRDFAVWFGRVFLPKRLPDVQLPPLGDLSEVYHMLAENLETWTDQWKREGMEQGMEQGREAIRGEAKMLLRLIERKFAPPSEPVRARITQADLDTLLDWSERILVAQSLDEVLH